MNTGTKPANSAIINPINVVRLAPSRLIIHELAKTVSNKEMVGSVVNISTWVDGYCLKVEIIAGKAVDTAVVTVKTKDIDKIDILNKNEFWTDELMCYSSIIKLKNASTQLL